MVQDCRAKILRLCDGVCMPKDFLLPHQARTRIADRSQAILGTHTPVKAVAMETSDGESQRVQQGMSVAEGQPGAPLQHAPHPPEAPGPSQSQALITQQPETPEEAWLIQRPLVQRPERGDHQHPRRIVHRGEDERRLPRLDPAPAWNCFESSTRAIDASKNQPHRRRCGRDGEV